MICDTENLFEPQTQVLQTLLTKSGQCLYIPAYQRPYSWGEPQLSKLFTDIVHGFSLFVSPDNIKRSSHIFLGSIIAVHDPKNTTVIIDDKNRKFLPAAVMTVIDGQQRLSSLLLLISVIHAKLRIEYNNYFKISNDNPQATNLDDEADTWLSEVCRENLNTLFKCLMDAQSEGNDRWYPRMIRAYEDTWNKQEGIYHSLIANYLHEYTKVTLQSLGSCDLNYLPSTAQLTIFKTQYKKITKKNAVDKQKTPFVNAVSYIDKMVNDFFDAQANDDDEKNMDTPYLSEIPTYEHIADCQDLAEYYPQCVKDRLYDNSAKRDFAQLTRFVFFISYMLKKVCVTLITAKNEDCAFDIFESLNTTGEPLTALETFKPQVIAKVEMKKFQASKEKDLLTTAENYLDTFEQSKKSKATSKFLVTFALCYSGDKLSERINEQRNYMRKLDLTTEDNRLSCLKTLAKVAQFSQEFWVCDPFNIGNQFFEQYKAVCSDLTQAQTNINIATCCLHMLREFKHTICISVLIRYLYEIDENASELQFNNFFEAVKAVSAFSILWRASRTTTDGLDAKYRTLLKKGYTFNPPYMQKLNKLCIQNSTVDLHSSIPLLKQVLKQILIEKGNIPDKEAWVAATQKIPLFKINEVIAKFLLIVAEDHTSADKNTPFLRCKDANSSLDLLTATTWYDSKYITVDCIAPQNNKNWTNNDIYEQHNINDDVCFYLGNLVLLPKLDKNTTDTSWSKKALLFKALGTDNDVVQDIVKKSNISVTEQNYLLKLAKDYHGSPFAQDLAQYPMDRQWNVEAIKQRSKRICELAWDTLHTWINF